MTPLKFSQVAKVSRTLLVIWLALTIHGMNPGKKLTNDGIRMLFKKMNSSNLLQLLMFDGRDFGFWTGLNFKVYEQRISLVYSVFYLVRDVEDFSFIKGSAGLKYLV